MRWRREPTIRTKRRLTGLPPAFRRLWPYAKRLHTTAVGTSAPLTQALSRMLGGSLPQRTARTVEEAAARGEGRVVMTRRELQLSRAVPVGIPERHPAFVARAEQAVPRVVVAELPGGRVLGPYRAVITAGSTLIGELSPYFGTTGPRQNPVFADLFAPRPTSVEGRVGVLAARGDVSYFHYLTDVLPRLALLDELDVPPDRLYVPASLPFQRQLLELFEIPSERIIDADQVRHVQAETLVVPSLPDADLRIPPWVIAFLRERLLPPKACSVPGRRLYATRGQRRGSRMVANEAEVVHALEGLGFTVIDPGAMPVAEQIRAFSEAEWIVSPHGAALANLAFASPGAAVLELLAPNYVQGCYWKISDCVPGLTYRYLVGVGRMPRSGRMEGVDSDITVDVKTLLSLVEELPRAGAQSARATIK